MKTPVAIHRACSHLIPSAPILPATADLGWISLRKKKKKKGNNATLSFCESTQPSTTFYVAMKGRPPTLPPVMRPHVRRSTAFSSPALSSRQQPGLAEDQSQRSPRNAITPRTVRRRRDKEAFSLVPRDFIVWKLVYPDSFNIVFEFKMKEKITSTLTKYFLLKTKYFLINIFKRNRGLLPLFAGLWR